MHSINNHIMTTKCPIDMKQTALEREFHKFSLYVSLSPPPKKKTCFWPLPSSAVKHICAKLSSFNLFPKSWQSLEKKFLAAVFQKILDQIMQWNFIHEDVNTGRTEQNRNKNKKPVLVVHCSSLVIYYYIFIGMALIVDSETCMYKSMVLLSLQADRSSVFESGVVKSYHHDHMSYLYFLKICLKYFKNKPVKGFSSSTSKISAERNKL